MAVPRPDSPFVPATAFDGRVTEILARGARHVRLANGHTVMALPSGKPAGEAPLPGDRVTVELSFRELHGWRLVSAERELCA